MMPRSAKRYIVPVYLCSMSIEISNVLWVKRLVPHQKVVPTHTRTLREVSENTSTSVQDQKAHRAMKSAKVLPELLLDAMFHKQMPAECTF